MRAPIESIVPVGNRRRVRVGPPDPPRSRPASAERLGLKGTRCHRRRVQGDRDPPDASVLAARVAEPGWPPQERPEITPVEPDLVRTSEGSDVKSTELGNRARTGTASRARLRRHDPALGQPRHLAACARAPGLLRPVAEEGARRRRWSAGLIGNSMLALAALIGADGRVPTMVPPGGLRSGSAGSYIATVLNIAPVPRLGDLRADRDRDRPRGCCATGCSGSRRPGLGSSSSAGSPPRLALMGPIGFRAPLRAQVSRSGRSRCQSPTSRGGSSTARTSATSGRTRAAHHGSFWARGRHGDRGHGSRGRPLVADYTRFLARTRRSAFFRRWDRLPASRRCSSSASARSSCSRGASTRTTRS